MARAASDARLHAGRRARAEGPPEPVEAFEVAWEPLAAEEADAAAPARACVGVPADRLRRPRAAERERSRRLWDEARERRAPGRAGRGRARDRQDPARHPRRARAPRRRGDGALRALRGGPRRPLRALDRGARPLRRARARGGAPSPRGAPRRRADPPRSRRSAAGSRRSAPRGDRPRDRALPAVRGGGRPARARRPRPSPVVLLLDDLHWADKPTLALLKHVVGGSASPARCSCSAPTATATSPASIRSPTCSPT